MVSQRQFDRPDSHVTETNFALANGATQFQLRFEEVRYEDDATYHVVLTDDCGSVAQPPFTLRVTPNPPWLRVATEGPPSRHGAAMCYDSDRQVTVLFGGATWASGPAGFLGDTWEFDGTNWTQRLPAISPAGRAQANMVYDTKRHRTVLLEASNTRRRMAACSVPRLGNGMAPTGNRL